MKKILLITVSLLLSCHALLADFVTPDEAREVAARFFGYSGNGAVKSSIPVRMELSWTETVHPEGLAESPAYYVYNREGGGYVIISAESDYHPVIAYSNTETFDVNALPDGYRYLLGHLADDVTGARLSGRPVSSDVAVEWQMVGIRTKAAKEKVLETADWNQGYPYNIQCPTVNGQYCVTGCVATATAILMRHQGAKEGAPNTPEDVTLPGYDISGGRCQPRDLTDRVYDFANMPLKDGDVQKASDKVKQSIAELMADIGCAIKMSYSPNSSGANTPEIIKVMGEYFRYDRNNAFEPRGAYSFSEWQTKIRESIDNDNPVLVSGYSPDGGHAFLMDGYDENGFVRYNFGWGGMYHDSFVRTGYDFDINQIACFNHAPAKGDSQYPVTPVYLYSYRHEGLSLKSGKVAKGEDFTLTCDAVTQYGPLDRSFVIRAVLVSGGSRRKISSNYYSATLPTFHYVYPFDLHCKIDSDVKMGDYIELEYSAENTTSAESVKTWLPLNKPDDGTVVSSYPAIPAFYMDIPSSVKVGISVELKLMNGKIPWASRTEWSWSAVTPGGQAEIQTHSNSWNFIKFNKAGTYNVIATIKDGSGKISDNVVARVTVTE